MFSTIVRDIFAVVGVVATISGVWIGVIAYRAAKTGERRIVREIKRKTRPRYVIGQVAGWVALPPWLAGSPPSQEVNEQPAHPAVRPSSATKTALAASTSRGSKRGALETFTSRG